MTYWHFNYFFTLLLKISSKWPGCFEPLVFNLWSIRRCTLEEWLPVGVRYQLPGRLGTDSAGLRVLQGAWKLSTTEEQKLLVILSPIELFPRNSGKFVPKNPDYSGSWAGAMSLLSGALCIEQPLGTWALWLVLLCDGFPPFPSPVLLTALLVKSVDCRQHF